MGAFYFWAAGMLLLVRLIILGSSLLSSDSMASLSLSDRLVLDHSHTQLISMKGFNSKI